MIASLERIFTEFEGARRDALIPLLQRIQEEHGYLSEGAIVDVGRHLGVPASKVYGVATFYNQFRLQPRGRCHVQVCRGTACHVKGSVRLLEVLVKHLRTNPGQTSKDGAFSLEVVACMGACGLSPALNVNGEIHAKVTPKKLERIVEAYRERAALSSAARGEGRQS
jgi:NADH-quinone oxidoreductase subunit E